MLAADPVWAKPLQFKAATIAGLPLCQHNIETLTETGKLDVKEPWEVVILPGTSTDALSDAAFLLAVADATVKKFFGR